MSYSLQAYVRQFSPMLSEKWKTVLNFTMFVMDLLKESVRAMAIADARSLHANNEYSSNRNMTSNKFAMVKLINILTAGISRKYFNSKCEILIGVLYPRG